MLQILQKIRQERVSAGLYRSGMVKILGVSQQVYSNIEAGKVKKLAAEFVRNYEKWSGHTSKIVDEKITATVDAGKQISENIDEILELKAGLEVLKTIVSAFAAEKKGSSVAKERLEIDKICEEQYGLFFSELKRKRKQEA